MQSQVCLYSGYWTYQALPGVADAMQNPMLEANKENSIEESKCRSISMLVICYEFSRQLD